MSSNDLTELVSSENPHADVQHAMNGVMILIGKPKGWKSVQEIIMGKDFLHALSKYDFTKATQAQIKEAKAEMESIGELEQNGKAYAAFGLWVSSIIGCSNVQTSIVP